MTAAPVSRSDSRTINLIGLGIGIVSAIVVILVSPRDGDPLVFLNIANPIASGAIPYIDFPVEYPPLALLPLVLPRILTGVDSPPMAYQFIFGLASLAATVLSGAVVIWLARRGWSAQSDQESLIVFLAIALALSLSVIWRFDIWPAFLTIAAVAAVAAGRPAWAGFALGLGVAMKLYPAFLAPVLLAYYVCGRRWPAAALFGFGLAATVGGVFLPAYLVAGPDSLSFLNYQRDRGIEIESVVGGLVLLADNVAGINARVFFDFQSFQVESPVADALAVPVLVAEIALALALLVGGAYAFLRDARVFGHVRPRTLIAYIVATLLLVMLANKVLSPQYLGWLLPFGALLPRRQAVVLVVACALTTVVYPIAFDGLRVAHPLVVAALNGRNLLLLVLFVWLIVPRQERAAESQIVATLEAPPSKPAPMRSMSSPGQRTGSGQRVELRTLGEDRRCELADRASADHRALQVPRCGVPERLLVAADPQKVVVVTAAPNRLGQASVEQMLAERESLVGRVGGHGDHQRHRVPILSHRYQHALDARLVAGDGNPRSAMLDEGGHGLVDEAAKLRVVGEVHLAISPSLVQQPLDRVERLGQGGRGHGRLDHTAAVVRELAHLPAHHLARLGAEVFSPPCDRIGQVQLKRGGAHVRVARVLPTDNLSRGPEPRRRG